MREGYGVRVWKAIRRWWPLVNDKVSFLGGKWVESEVLEGHLVWPRAFEQFFPIMFAKANSKDAWVSDLWFGPKCSEG